MTEEKQKSGNRMLDSRFLRTLLILVAAFLTFGAPTYLIYVFIHALDMNFFVSMGAGFALFVVGLVLLWYLIRKKVVS